MAVTTGAFKKINNKPEHVGVLLSLGQGVVVVQRNSLMLTQRSRLGLGVVWMACWEVAGIGNAEGFLGKKQLNYRALRCCLRTVGHWNSW